MGDKVLNHAGVHHGSRSRHEIGKRILARIVVQARVRLLPCGSLVQRGHQRG
jgi:hypothetical protein